MLEQVDDSYKYSEKYNKYKSMT